MNDCSIRVADGQRKSCIDQRFRASEASVRAASAEESASTLPSEAERETMGRWRLDAGVVCRSRTRKIELELELQRTGTSAANDGRGTASSRSEGDGSLARNACLAPS